MLRRTLAALLAGSVLSLAFEPIALAYLMPVALAGFALTTRGVRPRRGFVVGLAFGLGFYLPHIYWLSESIAPLAWIALAVVEALFYGVLGVLATLLHRLRAWPAWLAAAWTTTEILRSNWPFSGLPWGRLGFGVVDTALAPALAYVGVNGVTLLVAAIGFLLARVLVARRGDERLLALGALVGVTALSVLPTALPWTLSASGDATVAVVQGNVPGRGNDVLYDSRGLTQNHVDATVGLAAAVAAGESPRPDFVLWPENSTAIDPFGDEATYAQIETAVAAIDTPVLVGTIVGSGPGLIRNQGIVWDPVSGPGERYTKLHPVAFGEYIPWRSALAPTGITEQGQLARVPRDMVRGTPGGPLSVGGVAVADSICFDIAYDDGLASQIEAGAELLTVQTSNATFIFTDQIEQQFAITRARAIETGKYVAVASTNGVSGVIAPDGAVVARTTRLTQDVLVEDVELRAGVTPGTRVGPELALVAPGLTLLGLLLASVTSVRERRRRRPGQEPVGD